MHLYHLLLSLRTNQRQLNGLRQRMHVKTLKKKEFVEKVLPANLAYTIRITRYQSK